MDNRELLNWIHKEISIFKEDEYDNEFMSSSQIKTAKEILQELEEKRKSLDNSIERYEKAHDEIIKLSKKVLKKSNDYEYLEIKDKTIDNTTINVNKPLIIICDWVNINNSTFMHNQGKQKLLIL